MEQDDRVSRLEARVEELSRRLARLEGQVPGAAPEALGKTALDAPREGEPWTPAPSLPELGPDLPSRSEVTSLDIFRAVSLAGRTLVALGGAFLLRALTEAGRVPLLFGIALGLAYASLWLGFAYRAAAEHRRSSVFHALGAVLVAGPLLWEAVARFQVLPALVAAILLAVLASFLLLLAWRYRLSAHTWLAALTVAGASWASLFSTAAWLPYGLLVCLLGLSLLFLRGAGAAWPGVAGAAAWIADGTVLALALALLGERASVTEVTVVGSTLAAGYVAVFLVCRETPGAFAFSQTAVALAVGFGPVAALAHTGALPLAVVAGGSLGLGLLLDLGIDLAALRPLPQREHLAERRVYASWVGLALVMAGSGLWLGGLARVLVWSGLAVVAVMRARAWRQDLSPHAVVLLLGAAWVSGLVGVVGYGFGAPVGTPWPPLTAGALVVTAVAIAVAALGGGIGEGGRRLLLRIVALALSTLGAGGALLYALAAWAGESAGALATWRTAVLAGVAVSAAAVRSRGWKEAAPLGYTLLLLGFVKLLAEDFPRGRPATLFVALALYGVALIIVARLVRGREPGSRRPLPGPEER